MNITVMVPDSLKAAVDGRNKLELGVPASSDIGDVVQTLLALYPKLLRYLPNENNASRQHLNIFVSEHASRELSRKRSGLREGQVLYLFASKIDQKTAAGL